MDLGRIFLATFDFFYFIKKKKKGGKIFVWERVLTLPGSWNEEIFFVLIVFSFFCI